MSDAGQGIDALGIYLTGGASNNDPKLSLGGVESSVQVKGMGAKITDAVPALQINQVFPTCGEGSGLLRIDSNSDVLFTPPGGVEGSPVTFAAGESKTVSGVDVDKAILVTREAGLNLEGYSTLDLVFAVNGVLSQNNVTDAQRVAGVTTYRGLILKAHSDLLAIKLWMPPVAGAQAVYSLATEATVMQTIANETTAPTAVSWVTPTTEGGALTIASMLSGAAMGLWIRRVFPVAGTVDLREDFKLTIKYSGA